MSWPRNRSRSGCSATSASSSPTSAPCRPRPSSASISSSSAVSRNSPSRAISLCANDSYATSASAGPRQSPIASRKVPAARAGSPRTERRSTLPEQQLEPPRVHLVLGRLEDVARRARDHSSARVAERAAKLGNPDAQRRLPAAGLRRAPELLEEDVLRNDLVRADGAPPAARAASPRAAESSAPHRRFRAAPGREYHRWLGTLHPFARRYGLVTGGRDSGFVKPKPRRTMENTYAAAAASARRRRTRFHRRDHRGDDQLPRVARQQLGRAVLAPEGLHAGVHDRARPRVGKLKPEFDKRNVKVLGLSRRSARLAQGLGERHQGDARATRSTSR